MLPIAKLKTLANGVRIVTVPLPASEISTIVVAIKAGTRGERPHERGIAHLAEHLVFKGTTAYPTPQAVNAAVADIGGNVNAGTSLEYTFFIIEAPKLFIRKAFSIVSDIVLRPLIPASEFSRERKVVYEESLQGRQDDSSYAEVLFEDLLYGHQPLGWDITGTIKTLRSLRSADIRRYINRWYTPNHMAVAILGGGSIDQILTEAIALYGTLPACSSPSWRPYRRLPIHKQQRHLHRDDPVTALTMGVPALSIHSPLVEAQKLLDEALAGNFASRLYNRLREKEGLVYDISSESEFYSDAGHTAVSTEAETKNAQRVVEAIREEYGRLVRVPLSAKELKQAKISYLGKLASLPEEHEDLALYYLVPLLLTNRLPQMERTEQRIQAVKLDTIRRLSKRLFNTKNYFLASIGKEQLDLPDIG
ncbi:MAG: pitrilysin family protein [bacterium]